MLSAIYFDNQFCSMTIEIRNIMADRLLPLKTNRI